MRLREESTTRLRTATKSIVPKYARQYTLTITRMSTVGSLPVVVALNDQTYRVYNFDFKNSNVTTGESYNFVLDTDSEENSDTDTERSDTDSEDTDSEYTEPDTDSEAYVDTESEYEDTDNSGYTESSEIVEPEPEEPVYSEPESEEPTAVSEDEGAFE